MNKSREGKTAHDAGHCHPPSMHPLTLYDYHVTQYTALALGYTLPEKRLPVRIHAIVRTPAG